MQYTEEDYAQMYNDLPEGLKDLVLSGRLAILVSAIGSRHGLNADQVADLEPAIEDVCLGLITQDELVDNILKSVNVDQRVANRIAAEAELEILRPFAPELVIARKQKEDLDEQIKKRSGGQGQKTSSPIIPNIPPAPTPEPKDVSEHAPAKKVSDWYSKNDDGNIVITSKQTPKTSDKKSFDWDKDFAKKVPPASTEPDQTKPENINTSPSIESKLDVLTESINKLVNSRFGSAEKKDDNISSQMQELLKRLEKAEKENEENKKIIKSLQASKTEDKQNKIQIDKERKVEIDKTQKDEPPTSPAVLPNGNVQVTNISKPVPIEKIVSSSVSKDTLDSIVETRNKPVSNTTTSAKKVLSIDELISKGDSKIKEATSNPKTGTLVFPGLNDEKKIDIKNINQKDSMRQTLLSDLEFLAQKEEPTTTNTDNNQNNTSVPTGEAVNTETSEDKTDDSPNNQTSTNNTNSNLYNPTPFKDELLPKTKEERMRALQDKIKSLNKGISTGGKTNIAASGLDPYKI